ncbi:helix-turn-helix domain-containing protein [Vibrio ostreicida]|uniref:AraC family transcriptional regulator n=1 Tax=Vibrio ostreicida TaxID=526588 RepID=A0ABT8BVW5_9VIBR|nr:AraC family transcriptional regulator [Vibrio ostreicida]MDN3611297.1 AraC family transcriptional regulator [Vibrio ostreicida]NPD09240.1 helix-turn-helix transcriptional regulator [Vibrio ostreicida]
MEHIHNVNVENFVDMSFEGHGHTAHHPEHRLALLTKGFVEMVYGENLRIAAPAIIIIPPGVPHKTVRAEQADMYLVSFCIGCLGINEDSLLMQPFQRVTDGSMPTVPVDVRRLALLIQILEALSNESHQSGVESTPLLRSYLSILFGDIYRGMNVDNDHSPMNKIASEALRFINQNSHCAISLKEVATAVHRVPSHVTTIVKKETGFTVGEWICQARIKKASYRLSHSTLSVQEIASELDWKDITHFIRQFKKVTGQTPAQWRKKQAKTASSSSNKPLGD